MHAQASVRADEKELTGEVRRVREVRTSTCQHWLGSDGVIRTTALEGARQKAEHAEENLRVYEDLMGAGVKPLLMNFANAGTVESDAQLVYRQWMSKRKPRMAVLIDSFLGRVMGNLIAVFMRGVLPVKLFGSEQDALVWLLQK